MHIFKVLYARISAPNNTRTALIRAPCHTRIRAFYHVRKIYYLASRSKRSAHGELHSDFKFVSIKNLSNGKNESFL